MAQQQWIRKTENELVAEALTHLSERKQRHMDRGYCLVLAACFRRGDYTIETLKQQHYQTARRYVITACYSALQNTLLKDDNEHQILRNAAVTLWDVDYPAKVQYSNCSCVVQ